MWLKRADGGSLWVCLPSFTLVRPAYVPSGWYIMKSPENGSMAPTDLESYGNTRLPARRLFSGSAIKFRVCLQRIVAEVQAFPISISQICAVDDGSNRFVACAVTIRLLINHRLLFQLHFSCQMSFGCQGVELF